MLTLLRNISPTTIPDYFAFFNYNMTILLRENLVLPFNKTIAYHFDHIVSFSFDPALIYLDTVVLVIAMPEGIKIRVIGVMWLHYLIARGFTIQRGYPWDTIERVRVAVDQFTDRQ